MTTAHRVLWVYSSSGAQNSICDNCGVTTFSRSSPDGGPIVAVIAIAVVVGFSSAVSSHLRDFLSAEGRKTLTIRKVSNNSAESVYGRAEGRQMILLGSLNPSPGRRFLDFSAWPWICNRVCGATGSHFYCLILAIVEQMRPLDRYTFGEGA